MVTGWWGASKAGKADATASGPAAAPSPLEAAASTKARGDAAETRALAWLQARGL
jgi:hypothetical protein